MGGGSAKTSPVIEKIGKTSPCPAKPVPHPPSELGGKFLGFFKGIFWEISGIFQKFQGIFRIFGEFLLNLTGFSLI